MGIFMLFTNLLPEAICCLQTCNVYGTWVTLYCLFTNVLPEAICCCLQTCYVDVMLLLMDCVCIITFIVVTLLVV